VSAVLIARPSSLSKQHVRPVAGLRPSSQGLRSRTSAILNTWHAAHSVLCGCVYNST